MKKTDKNIAIFYTLNLPCILKGDADNWVTSSLFIRYKKQRVIVLPYKAPFSKRFKLLRHETLHFLFSYLPLKLQLILDFIIDGLEDATIWFPVNTS